MNKLALASVGLLILITGGILFTKSDRENAPSPSSENHAPEEIKLGAVLSLTGAGAHDGNDMKMGIDLAVRELTEHGKTIHVEYQDDATDPKKTISALQILKAKEITTVVGLTWGYIASAAIPTVESLELTVFSPANSSDIVGGASSTKRLRYGAVNIHKQTESVSTWLTDRQAAKVAIFSTQDTWGTAHINVWSQAAKQANVEITQTEELSYANEAEVMPAIVQKAKKNSVDAILWTGTEAGAIALLKELERQNLSVAVLGTKFVRIAVDGKKGPHRENLYSIETKVSSDFEERFQTAYDGTLPSEYAEAAYRMTYDIVENRDLSTRYDAQGDTRDGDWVIRGL